MATLNNTIKRDLSRLRVDEHEVNYQMFDNVRAIPKALLDLLNSYRSVPSDVTEMSQNVNETMNAYANIADLASGNMQDLKTLLAQMTSEPENAFSMKSIMRNITTHPVGILSGVTNLLRSPDATTFIASFTTIFSLLGLEGGLIEKAKAHWTPIENSSSPVATYQANSSMIKLCCMLVSILGEGTDVVGTVMKGLRNSQKDHDTVKRLIEEIEDMAEDLGMGFSTRTKVIRELKTQIEGLMIQLHEFDDIMAVSPARFCRSDTYSKFLDVGKTLHKFKTDLATIKMKDFVGTSMNAEIQLLDARYNKMKTTIVKVRGCNAERVKPTGIVLKGRSQIGKSHVMTKIEQDIRTILYNKYLTEPGSETMQAFAEANTWTTWSQNMRDKYDQGYNGQHGHSIDDAFSSKECLEHQSIINWISNRPVPTYQAEMQSKGDPYECKYLLASCNNFPRDSTTINNVDALCNRFPIFVHAVLKQGVNHAEFMQSAEIDWDFNHLEFHLSTGNDYYANNGRACGRDDGCRNGRIVTYDQLLEAITTNMIMNQSKFDSIQAQTKAQFQGKPSDGEYHETNTDDCKGCVSRSQAAIEVLLNPLTPIYKTFSDLPSNVQTAIRTSKTTNPDYILPEVHYATSASGDYMQDFMAFCGSADIVSVMIASKHYKPLPRYTAIWDTFFAKSCIVGVDFNYVWCGGDMYFNDYSSPDGMENVPRDFPKETYGAWILRNYPFLSKLFSIFGEWSGAIWSGLLYALLCAVGMSSFAAWSIVTSLQAFCVSNSIGQFLLILACFAVMYILYRLVYYIISSSLHLISEATWLLFPGMRNLFEEEVEYESNSTQYVPEELRPSRRITVIGCKEDGSSILNYDWFKCLSHKDGSKANCTPGRSWGMKTDQGFTIGVVVQVDGKLNFKLVRSALKEVVKSIESKFPQTQIINMDSFGSDKHELGQLTLLLEEIVEPSFGVKLMTGSIQLEKGYDQAAQRSKKTWRPINLEKGASGAVGSGPRNRRTARPARPTAFEGIDGNWRTEKLKETSKVRRFHRSVPESDSEDEIVCEKGASGSVGSSGRNRRSARPARVTKFEKKLVALEKMQIPKLSDPDSEFEMDEYCPSAQEAWLGLDEQDMLHDNEDEDDYIKFESLGGVKLDQVLENKIKFQPNGPSYQSAIDSAALDMMRKCVSTVLCRVTTASGSLHGWGYDTFVFAPSHISEGVGDTAICTRKVRNVESKHLYRMKCVVYKKEWELCLFKILPISHPSYRQDENRPLNDLVFTKDVLKYVPLSCDVAGVSKIKTVIQYLPVSDLICSGKAEYEENYVVKTICGESINTNIYAITSMRTLGTHTQDGDCGGFVVMLDPYSTKKLIGMHFASQTRGSAAMSIVCTKERFDKLLSEAELVKYQSLPTFPKIEMAEQHGADHFDSLISEGYGILMPDNKNEDDPAFTYIGDLAFLEPPCDVKGKTDHKKSVFHGAFPVTKIPSALLESQVQDTSALALDSNGRPSILKTQLNANGDGKFEMDQTILDKMLPQLIEHFKSVLNGESIGTSVNFKSALWESVNGQFFNPDYEKINFKSSAGIPWKQMGASVKSHFFEDAMIPNPLNKDEYVPGKVFLKDEKSLFLRKVLKHKLLEAQQLRRTFSMWKCCLKDEVRAIKKVMTGQTRCFQAPSIEIVLFGRMLLGRFKAQYKNHRSKLFHAIGINPMSADWTTLANDLLKHPNFVDVDYKNFDQRLLAQAMRMAAVIVVETIFATEQNREMANARYVYFDEVIRAFCVAGKTVFQTEHGNKSGNIFTTEFNNIVNTIYSWYVFIKRTGNYSLSYYLDNVVEKNFGDDKVLSISNEVIGQFNFLTYKEEMEKLGQIITPGDKSEIEKSHSTNLSDMIFLKRHFTKLGSIWICPLEKESIEGVFNYSSLEDDEVEEWFSTMLEQLIEASLWGRTYFLGFQKTLLRFALDKNFYAQNRTLCARIYPILRAEFRQIFCIALDRFGVLESNISQILRKNLSENTCYQRFELKREVQNSVNSTNQTQSTQNIKYQSLKKTTSPSFIPKMFTTTPKDMNVSKSSRVMTLNGGLTSPNDIDPEGPIQPQNVQSDIGPPKLMSTADGQVWVYSLQQSDQTFSGGYDIPTVIDRAMSLPKEIQHFQLGDSFTVATGTSNIKLSPNLQQAAPKAYNLMNVFEYMRPKTTILRLDCRPPMGYSQVIKVISSSVESTDVTVINRRGVTYDLAANPTMYFEVPYASRDFMKTRDELFFNVIVGNISDPVNSSTNPSPVYIKPSYMVNELDYFVHRTVATGTTPAPIGSLFEDQDAIVSQTATGFTHPAFGPDEQPFGSAPITTVQPIILFGTDTGAFFADVTVYPTGTSFIPSQVNTISAQYAILLTTTGGTNHFLPQRITPSGSGDSYISVYTSNNRGVPVAGYVYSGTPTMRRRKRIVKENEESNEIPNSIDPVKYDGVRSQSVDTSAFNNYMNSFFHQFGDDFIISAPEEMPPLEPIVYQSDNKEVEDETDHLISLDEATPSWLEKAKNLVMRKQTDHVSILKELADAGSQEAVYFCKRVGGPDHLPIFSCKLTYGSDQVEEFGQSKKVAKDLAAKAMLNLTDPVKYQMDRPGDNFDTSAAEPTVAMDTRPPIGVSSSRPQNHAIGKTIGTVQADVRITQHDFVPYSTYSIAADADQIFAVRIHPGNWTANGAESVAQQQARYHTYTGPTIVGGKPTYATYKLTTAANFRQNARFIIAQVPLTYSVADIAALPASDLKQFPNEEHKLHGTETIFEPQWINRLPALTNHLTDPTNTNGWLVCKILENSLAATESSAKLTLWVCANNVTYSFPRVPAALPAVAT